LLFVRLLGGSSFPLLSVSPCCRVADVGIFGLRPFFFLALSHPVVCPFPGFGGLFWTTSLDSSLAGLPRSFISFDFSDTVRLPSFSGHVLVCCYFSSPFAGLFVKPPGTVFVPAFSPFASFFGVFLSRVSSSLTLAFPIGFVWLCLFPDVARRPVARRSSSASF